MSHPFHPVSELFPLMTGAPFDELVADIKANGLRESIWRHDGQIIDGRNRYLACEQSGIEPTYREWDGMGDLTKFVVSLNLHRRHLKESQRAMIGAKLALRPRGGNVAQDKKRSSNCEITPSVSEVAELLKVNEGTIHRAKHIRESAAPEVIESVERGDASIYMAGRVIDLPKEEQPAALAHELSMKGKRNRTEFSSTSPRGNSNNGNGNGIVPKTRTIAGRKAPAAIRGAIGTLVGLASGLDSFTVKDAAPTAEEAEQWERDLAVVISAINRFRRQLKEHVHV